MRGLTLRQIAERFNVPIATARRWHFAQHLFPNATLEQTVVGPVWIVPMSDVKAFTPPKMGRPKKATTKKADKKSTKKGEGKRSSTDETNG